VPLPAGARGLALAGDALTVIGVSDAATQSYLENVRAAWVDIVRADALARLTRAATRALRAISEELADAREAEQIGVPPPGGRSSADVQAALEQGRQAFRLVYQEVESATSVAAINTALEQARDNGLTWLVGLDWEPYPETCPWMVGT